MANWRFGIGNCVSRAAVAPVAVSPALADAVLALSNWGSGYPDERGGFKWRADGTYAADFDLNMLLATSERADAPSGWFDLPLYLAGTTGLPANPASWGTFAGRTALRVYGPTAQDVEVMPGDTVKITGGIYRPAASDATGVEVRVVDLTSGRQYDAGTPGWDDDGVISSQATDDAWLDFDVSIPADTTHTERRRYRVVVSPLGGAGAAYYVYLSANGGSGSPALFGSVDMAAMIGHNIPVGATVTLSPQPSGTAITLTGGAQPTCFAVATAAILAQVWRLAITIPTALRPSAPRPIVGEPWIGSVRDFIIGGPAVGFEVSEKSQGQITVKARGRTEIIRDDSRPTGEHELKFTAKDDASFEQIRDAISRATAGGADPVLLLPEVSAFGGAVAIHGRVENKLAWTVLDQVGGGESARSFGLTFVESPFAAP